MRRNGTVLLVEVADIKCRMRITELFSIHTDVSYNTWGTSVLLTVAGVRCVTLLTVTDNVHFMNQSKDCQRNIFCDAALWKCFESSRSFYRRQSFACFCPKMCNVLVLLKLGKWLLYGEIVNRFTGFDCRSSSRKMNLKYFVTLVRTTS